MCELPLLQPVALFTRLEEKRLVLRVRLQAHVMGHEFRYKVLRLEDKAGN